MSRANSKASEVLGDEPNKTQFRSDCRHRSQGFGLLAHDGWGSSHWHGWVLSKVMTGISPPGAHHQQESSKGTGTKWFGWWLKAGASANPGAGNLVSGIWGKKTCSRKINSAACLYFYTSACLPQRPVLHTNLQDPHGILDLSVVP